MLQQDVFRYAFPTDAVLEDVEASLLLSLLAVESLHGEAQVRLEARHFLDREQRLLAIDSTNCVGRDLNKLITGFLIRELGPDGFTVRRAEHSAISPHNN